jgi:hypothetical protein
MVCDTMNEIDDQFAIAYALGSPKLEVLAVISSHNTLVHGHDSVNLYRDEAQRVIDLCQRSDVPCLQGAARPMEHINECLPSEGLDFIVNLAKQGVEFSILGTGPATDLAAFKLGYPELAKNVPIIWAGSFPDEVTWKKYKYGELNARADIAAWRVLYQNHENLVVLPGWPGVVKVAVENGVFLPELRLFLCKIPVGTLVLKIVPIPKTSTIPIYSTGSCKNSWLHRWKWWHLNRLPPEFRRFARIRCVGRIARTLPSLVEILRLI